MYQYTHKNLRRRRKKGQKYGLKHPNKSDEKIIKWQGIPRLWIGMLKVVKMMTLPKQATDSMQFLSKSQQCFMFCLAFCRNKKIIQKFIRNFKRVQKAKIVLKKKG